MLMGNGNTELNHSKSSLCATMCSECLPEEKKSDLSAATVIIAKLSVVVF